MSDQATSVAASPAQGSTPAPLAQPMRGGSVFPARFGVRFDPSPEPSAGGGGTAPPVQPQQNGTGAADDGFVRVSRAEWETAQRWKQQAVGAQTWHEKAKGLGFNGPDDLAALEPDLKVMRERGLKPGALARMFGPEAEADLKGGGEPAAQALTPEDIDKIVSDKLKRALAEQDHAAAVKAEADLIDKLAKDLYDEGATEYEQTLAKDALRARLEEMREAYADDHPLARDYLRPLDEATARKGLDHFKKLKAKAAGAQMNTVAQAANAKKPPAPTPAGQSAGQGKANNKDERKGRPTREDNLAKLQEIRARGGRGGTVSSLGG